MDDADYIQHDEVREIQRAMREATARKRAVSMKMQQQAHQNAMEHAELESILRAKTAELDRTKEILAQCQFDLKETRFELANLHGKTQKLSKDNEALEYKYRDQIDDLSSKLTKVSKYFENRTKMGLMECDGLNKTLRAIYKSAFELHQSGTGNSDALNLAAPKTAKQLLNNAFARLDQLTALLTYRDIPFSHTDTGVINVDSSSNNSSSSSGATVGRAARLKEQQEQLGQWVGNSALQGGNDDVDASLLDMCRSLEDENKTLVETVDTLRAQLAETSKDAAAQKLIPNYRLAIVRSRAHTANLLEQLRREQSTSHALRQQLHDSYCDLRKVVEEKRQLLTQMTAENLHSDARQSSSAVSRHTQAIDALESTQNHRKRNVRNNTSMSSRRSRSSRRDMVSTEYKRRDKDSNSESDYSVGGDEVEDTDVDSRDDDNDDYNGCDTPIDGKRHMQSKKQAGPARSHRRQSSTATSAPLSAPRKCESPRSAAASKAKKEAASTAPIEPTAGPVGTGVNAGAGAGDMKAELEADLTKLDAEIEFLKEKLGRAALATSQRIVQQVLSDAIGNPIATAGPASTVE